MANIREVADGEEQAWLDWAKDRPEVIQRLAECFKPWKLYRLKSSNHRVVLYSFSENNTVTVAVLGKYNLCRFERRVFGIAPDDLEECDLPAAGELLGVYLTEAEQLAYINTRRAEHGNPPLTQADLDEMTRDGDCAIE